MASKGTLVPLIHGEKTHITEHVVLIIIVAS